VLILFLISTILNGENQAQTI